MHLEHHPSLHVTPVDLLLSLVALLRGDFQKQGLLGESGSWKAWAEESMLSPAPFPACLSSCLKLSNSALRDSLPALMSYPALVQVEKE